LLRGILGEGRTNWYGRLARLSAAAAKALGRRGRPQVPARIRQRNSGPADRTPEALAMLVKNEIAKWTRVLKPAS
jgi:tripartite-type tricarboxylate transporter receptor subunit TctC